MGRAIKAHFQPGVEEAEVALILEAMVTTGFISIEAGKITYAESVT